MIACVRLVDQTTEVLNVAVSKKMAVIGVDFPPVMRHNWPMLMQYAHLRNYLLKLYRNALKNI